MDNSILKPTFKNANLALTAKQLHYLNGTTADTTNFVFYYNLVSRMATATMVEKVRGIDITVSPGQVLASKSTLAKEWNINRKTVIAMFKDMMDIGLIEYDSSRLSTIINLTSISGWYASGGYYKNPYYKPSYTTTKPQ